MYKREITITYITSHHDYSEQMFFTTHHQIISNHKNNKQKKHQTPQLGFNSVDYGEIEAAKEAKEGAQPIKRHHHFNNNDTTAI